MINFDSNYLKGIQKLRIYLRANYRDENINVDLSNGYETLRLRMNCRNLYINAFENKSGVLFTVDGHGINKISKSGSYIDLGFGPDNVLTKTRLNSAIDILANATIDGSYSKYMNAIAFLIIAVSESLRFESVSRVIFDLVSGNNNKEINVSTIWSKIHSWDYSSRHCPGDIAISSLRHIAYSG